MTKKLVVTGEVSIPNTSTYTPLCWKTSVYLCLHMCFPLASHAFYLSTSLPEPLTFLNSLFGIKNASNTYCSVSFPFFSILQVCQLLNLKNPLITGFGKIIHLGAQPQDTKNTSSQWAIEKMRSEWNRNQIKGKGVASFLAQWWRDILHTQVLPKKGGLGQNT